MTSPETEDAPTMGERNRTGYFYYIEIKWLTGLSQNDMGGSGTCVKR